MILIVFFIYFHRKLRLVLRIPLLILHFANSHHSFLNKEAVSNIELNKLFIRQPYFLCFFVVYIIPHSKLYMLLYTL